MNKTKDSALRLSIQSMRSSLVNTARNILLTMHTKIKTRIRVKVYVIKLLSRTSFYILSATFYVPWIKIEIFKNEEKKKVTKNKNKTTTNYYLLITCN